LSYQIIIIIFRTLLTYQLENMEYILGSKTKDLFYIIFSSLAGFLIVGIYWFQVHLLDISESMASMVTFIVFAILFDVRHFFPTYSRTLFDKAFLKDNSRWFFTSWIFILLVPVLVVFVLSLGDYKAFDSFVLFSILLRFTYVVGFYHLIKQNWGFMAIYKKKYGEDGKSDRWEKMLLLSGSFLPFIYISMRDHVWFSGGNYAFSPQSNEVEYILTMWDELSLAMLGLGLFLLAVGYIFKSKPQYKYVSRNLGFMLCGLFVIYHLIKANGADQIMTLLLVITGLVFIIALVQTIRFNKKYGFKNKEKWMVLISSLVLYSGIILLPIENKFVIVMGITLPHNIQYLAFTKVFNQQYYSNSPKKHGFAQILVEKAGLFFILSIVYALLFESMRTGVKLIPIDQSSESLQFARNLFNVFFLGMVMHHYYLDAVIWRVRKDKELSSNL